MTARLRTAPRGTEMPQVEQDTPHGSLTTRERVRHAVSEHGPVTAAELGRDMNLTPAAMRRHLDALVGDGIIEEREAPTSGTKKRGRPARAYVLTQAGHASMPDGYDALAHQVLAHLARIGGDAAVEAVARERALEIAHTVKPTVDAAGDDPAMRAQALAVALTDQGFSASSRPVAQGTPLAGVQLCQGHCPVQHVAASHPQFCEAEAEVFSEVLGVHVQRLASLAHGDHVCTTFIPTITTATEPSSRRQDDVETTAPESKEQR